MKRGARADLEGVPRVGCGAEAVHGCLARREAALLEEGARRRVRLEVRAEEHRRRRDRLGARASRARGPRAFRSGARAA